MHNTVLRCGQCGLARETKRGRDPIEVCFCLPFRHDRPFVHISNPRVLGKDPGKLVQRE